MLHVATWIAERETEFDPDKVTPGWEGFAFTGAMAALVIVLGFLLVGRLRRNQYRAEVREQIAEELAVRDEVEQGAPDAQGESGGAGESGDAGSADPGSGPEQRG